MAKLAAKGGNPVHTTGWPGWPVVDESEAKAVADVAKRGAFSGGAKTAEFEKKYAEYMNAKYGVCVNSGTNALATALFAAGVGMGDEVIIPPYTFVGTLTAVTSTNATPVFADIDPDNYCLDPKSVEQVITDKTKAILPVHLGGCPTDMDTMMKLAKKHNLMVIEDAAHAHGTRYKGKGAGSLGDLGGFSFQASKNLNCGEGGIVLTKDKALYDRCAAYHNCRRLPAEAVGSVDDIMGTNIRMTGFQAAILLAQFERFDEQSNIRDKNGAFITEQLRQIGGIKVPRPDYVTRHGYHLFVYTYDPKGFKGLPFGKFVGAMNAEGISCGGGYSPLYRDSIFRNPISRLPITRTLDYYAGLKLPNVEDLSTRTIWMYQTMMLGSHKDMQDIVEAAAKVRDNVDELL